MIIFDRKERAFLPDRLPGSLDGDGLNDLYYRG